MRVEVEPQTLEWHEWRANHRNASEASIIMDCAPKYWGMTKRKLVSVSCQSSCCTSDILSGLSYSNTNDKIATHDVLVIPISLRRLISVTMQVLRSIVALNDTGSK